MHITDQMIEAATRAFLRKIKPSSADAPMQFLNCVDLDDTEFEIVDAIRDALHAALTTSE